jgi:hypothetical protein
MQSRHHANVTRERAGTAEARRVAGLGDDAGGGQRSHAHYDGKELSNFVCIEAALNVALEITHSAAEYLPSPEPRSLPIPLDSVSNYSES